jgi:cobalamin biosynthesis protein CbiG
MELRVLVTRQVQVEAEDAATALQTALQQENLDEKRVLHTATVKPLGPFPPDQI